MSTESVSFKGYLKNGGGDQHDEVRRFMVDTAVSTNFVYLQEKLAAVFPDLKRRLFTVTWTDEDGDEVTIASDEELLIALTEMKGPLYKINIHVKGNKMAEEAGSSQENEEKEVHPGVTCDGCEGPVVGARYKCVVCPDYDLCSVCEAKGVHPGHNMMKMTKPGAAWPGHFFRRLHKMQERAEQREKRREKSDDKEQQQQQGERGNGGLFGGGWGWGRGRCGPGGRGGGGWGRGCGPRGRGGMFRGGMFPPGHPFDEMMRGWMGPEAANQYAADCASFQEEIHKGAEAAAKAAHEKAHEAASAAAAGNAAAANSHADYLRNMGEFIAAAMDPFGINVDVSVETPDGVKTKVSSSSSTTSSSTSTTTKDGEEKMNVDESAAAAAAPQEQETAAAAAAPAVAAAPARERENASDATLPKKMKLLNLEEGNAVEAEFDAAVKEFEEAVLEPEKEKSGSPTPSEDEDWTMLRKDEEKVVNVPINMQLQDGYKVLYADPEGNLYPKLPEQEVTVAPTAPATQAAPVAPVAPAAPAAPVAPVAPAAPAAPVAPAAPAPIPVAQHPDPKIQVALQAMLNMGFSNEGGWLTTLLEAKGGDIGKVLDLLRDVRK